ncbi:DUF6544 family protein [Marimonas arenosa]|uniref:Uncharacterized protein n=1 Tax=Marimonas arenosa TaxID=1795305 RepID=A0AAE4B5V8_9RHOB|nr:DUF6544 family protein [Marimonas arenosa]MDQ2092388.1 hypothetical protein [Marimonas arenosa]
MRWALTILGALVLVIWAAHLLSAWQFRRLAAGLVAEIGQGGTAVPREDLPAAVRAFARRGLSGQAPLAGRIRLEQAAEMELQPGGGWQAITARQTIGVSETGFVWEAWQSKGPLLLVRVIDAFTAGHGRLQVRLLGSVPVARAAGPEVDRGEAMRYLAELPWAPDAILLNRDLRWRVLESGEIEVLLKIGPSDAVVRFELDASGDLAVMRAEARYAGEVGGAALYKDWEGRFTDYGEIGGRRIPRRGEVGYMVDGVYQPYWRGRITGYRVE